MSGDKEKDNGDYLGYGVYADTLWARIQAALDKDVASSKALGDDPLVVGIFGEWGAGKSTLLKLVQRRAEAAAEQTSEAQENVLTVPVYFQPWKYEHEKHLLVPLVLHVVEAAREALKKSPTVRQQLVVLSKDADQAVGKVASTVHKSAKTARKWFPIVKKIVGSLSVFGVSIALPDEIDDWLKDAEAVFESPETKEQQRKASAKELRAKKLSFVDNGFHYYELHELLTALTRPGKTADTEDLTAQGAPAKNLRINFVIFIDDLDRCLPEKAVETLELIKTVFNLESFAFVLALDEEVVERGIGHRYKDYALVNKKPEMPITGFEYLEKIVHLPFRLPALSRSEGLQFLASYEQTLLNERSVAARGAYPPQAWFGRRETAIPPSRRTTAAGVTGSAAFLLKVHDALEDATLERAVGGGAGFHLGHAVVNAFDAYVPRKLIRVVELFHQVVEVAHERGRAVDERLGGERDPRLVLVFVMLQLFHPDLYRLLRRQGRGVDVLRDGFVQGQLRSDIADMDLLAWACFQSQPVLDLASGAAAIAAIQDDNGKRFPAQRLRLPIVERLLEHRAVQRHVFDPLKLFEGLNDSGAPFATASTRGYFSLLSRVAEEEAALRPLAVVELLAEQVQAGVGPDAALSARNMTVIVDGERLFVTLTSAESSERRGLAETLGLKQGQKLTTWQVQDLVRRVKAWLPKEESKELDERLMRLQDGLRYLGPFVNPADGAALWDALGATVPIFEPMLAYDNLESLKRAAQFADLHAALGLDKRFDPAFFCLPKHRHTGYDEENEPVPGFVWVQKERADFEPKHGGKLSLAPFLMARYLTTVQQFGAFVAGGGYQKRDWWDSQGWVWVTGEWDNHPSTPEWLRNRLGQRPVNERHCPAQWAQQRVFGSRPVWGVNWFEARAYANWLDQQQCFRDRLTAAKLGAARVVLPIEAQWERAARAAGLGKAPDDREYVWGDESKPVELFANVSESGLGGCSSVGLFPSSPLGISDLNGNLWEWQDNLRSTKGPHVLGERTRPISSPLVGRVAQSDWLSVAQTAEDSVFPALRGGGSWGSSAQYAWASIPNGFLPDVGDNYVGFRVVLYLAE